MNREFEQFLEAEWAGRLGEKGRRRLEALCADHAELAAQWRQEHRLSSLLARCGPNRAPEGLAGAVLTRLESAKAGKEGRLEQLDISGILRADSSRRQRRWAPWRPVLRWGFALAVLAVIGVEASWLTRQEARVRMPIRANLEPPRSALSKGGIAGKSSARQLAQEAALRRTRAAQANEAAARRSLKSDSTAPSSPMDATASPVPEPEPIAKGQHQTAGGIIQEALRGKAAEPAPLPDTAALAPEPANSGRALTTAVPPPAAPKPESPMDKLADFKAAPTETRPAMAASAPAEPERDATAGGLEQVKTVAVRIVMDRGARPLTSRTRGSGGKMKDTSLGMAVQAFEDKGEARASVEFAETAGGQSALREIEIAVAGSGGEILSRGQEGRSGLWRIRCSMTGAQLARFLHELEQSGVQPVGGPQVKAPRSSRPSGSHYEVTEGQLFFRQLSALAETGTVSAGDMMAAPVSPAIRSRQSGSVAPASRKIEVNLLVESFGAASSMR